MTWPQRLRIALKQKGYTLKAIGTELGVTESAVGHWFKGRRVPQIKDIQAMAKMAGLSMDELLNDGTKYLVADKHEIALIETLRSVPKSRTKLARTLIANLIDDDTAIVEN